MIYIVVFFISYLCAYAAETTNSSFALRYSKVSMNESSHHKIIGYDTIFFVMSLIGPIILGWTRDGSVGTDNARYIICFRYIHNISNINDLWGYSTLDVGYKLLMYLTSRITDNYNTFCLITTFLTVVPMALSLWKLRDKLSYSLGYLMFLLVFYCSMFNLVRQGVSLSLCTLAMVFLFEKKYPVYFALVIIASLIHSTSIVFIIVFILERILKDGKKFYFKVFIVSLIAVISMIYWRRIILLLTSHGLLLSRYEAYSEIQSRGIFNYFYMIFYFPFPMISAIYYLENKNKHYSNEYSIMAASSIIGYIFLMFSFVFDPMARIGSFFLYPGILCISYAVKNANANSRKILVPLIIIYSIVFWYFFTVMNRYGYHSPVYPFKFSGDVFK